MVLGAYYGIKDPRVRSAFLLIMSRIAGGVNLDRFLRQAGDLGGRRRPSHHRDPNTNH